MHISFAQILIWLFAGIGFIVFCTTRLRLHAFFALILACFVVGFGVEIPVMDTLAIIKTGFGNIISSLGLIIILGTTLGIILEHTGCTQVMAHFILRLTGKNKASLAMSITGFIVGLPIFCDSGYVVLSGLNQSLARRTGISLIIMSASLATGLLAVHCMVPPHPGATAAAGIIGVDFGKLILAGMAVAVPAAFVAHIWSKWIGKRFVSETTGMEEEIVDYKVAPGVLMAFLPILVPLLLIAFRSFMNIEKAGDNNFIHAIILLGEPAIALFIGTILAMLNIRAWDKKIVGSLMEEAVQKAGGILVIIGAGGAFGAVLAATKLGEHFGAMQSVARLGIFFPFFVTSLLKTAQGSSTVAIITAASIVQPLLGTLGLDSATGHLLCVLSMGAGSMMISHANDAYFWVITKFSGLEMKSVLLVYSTATLLMGSTAMLMVFILQKIIL